MKKNILKYILMAGVLGSFLTSCDKQLEIDPRQSIDANTALTSREAIEASLTSIYSRLKNNRNYGRDLITHPEALADNGFATFKSGRLVGEAANTLGSHFTGTIWTNGYAAINQINLTLEAIPALSGVTDADRNRWDGQLYFLRALYYFDMVKVYAYIPGAVVAAQDRGGVPITLEGISTSGGALSYLPARAPIDDVYTQIVADLTLANSKLLAPGAGVSPISLANKAAAQGLLARVNLYRKNYGEAKRWADSVITLAGSKLATTSNYVANWRAEFHQETLFQVRFATNAENIGVNESLQTSFTTLVVPGNPALLGGFGDLVPTLTLLNDLGILLTGGNTTPTPYLTANASIASRSTDVRNLLYEPGSIGRGPAKVECTKYIGKNGFINLDNVPIIRISDAYLIRAEAQVAQGSPVSNPAAALADLKTLKTRRYTDYVGSAEETADNAMDPSQLFEEIIRQRRIEFAYEGHRFFDLKRLGRDLAKAPHYNTVAFTDIRILPPIPQGDVDGNPNLVQNAGY